MKTQVEIQPETNADENLFVFSSIGARDVTNTSAVFLVRFFDAKSYEVFFDVNVIGIGELKFRN